MVGALSAPKGLVIYVFGSSILIVRSAAFGLRSVACK